MPESCYKIFVVFHKYLHEEFYLGKEEYYSFVKVGEHELNPIQNPKIHSRIIHCNKMSGFIPMGKHWAESEFFFSLYRTIKKEPSTIDGLKWLGFTQYDHTTESNGKDLVEHLNSYLSVERDEKDMIGFVPISMNYEIYSNRIAMDYSNPQKLQGEPSCYFPMIADYNKFYNTSKTYSNFISSKNIQLCSSFFMRTEKFMEMMEFCSWMINHRDLNLYDPQRKHRLCGGYMERYFGLWCILSDMKIEEFLLGCKR